MTRYALLGLAVVMPVLPHSFGQQAQASSSDLGIGDVPIAGICGSITLWPQLLYLD